MIQYDTLYHQANRWSGGALNENELTNVGDVTTKSNAGYTDTTVFTNTNTEEISGTFIHCM